MQFGMPTLIESVSIEESAALCRQLGLSFIELNMNLPQYQADNIDAARLADIAKSSGIYYTIHLDENFNVCDFNGKVASAYAQTAYAVIELAKKLSMPVINMHLNNGVYFTMPDRRIYLFDEYIDVFLDRLTSFRDECEKRIGDNNIIICIENSDGWDTQFSKRGIELLIESRVFGLTFDTGHSRSTGGGDEVFIMRHESRLCHMHLHDAKGAKNHLVLGTGEIDIEKQLALAKEHDLRVVLETKTIEGLKQSVRYIKTH